jgi:hypothetical protein
LSPPYRTILVQLVKLRNVPLADQNIIGLVEFELMDIERVYLVDEQGETVLIRKNQFVLLSPVLGNC